MKEFTIKTLREWGYKEFPTPLGSFGNKADLFFQKKIPVCREEDKYIYIDAYIYDFNKIDPREGIKIQFEAQFNTDYKDTTFNVSTVNWDCSEKTLSRVEEFFMELYRLGQIYKEVKED